MKQIHDGVIGLTAGDALGVPAEFKSRAEIADDPAVSMRGYGTHSQPAGTWSDDTSMTLALLDSIEESEISSYDRLRRLDGFMKLPEKDISSSGYVVHTLEAALWCLLNTDTYEQCVLKAVNLGDDTDTVGAVAGGLAGIYYGARGIPEAWLDVVARRGYIMELCERAQGKM